MIQSTASPCDRLFSHWGRLCVTQVDWDSLQKSQRHMTPTDVWKCGAKISGQLSTNHTSALLPDTYLYFTRLPKRKRQQLPVNRMLVTHLWLLRVHRCIHLHTLWRPSYALPCSFCGTHFKQALLCPKQTATSSISSSSAGPQCINWIEDARTAKHTVKQKRVWTLKHNFIK